MLVELFVFDFFTVIEVLFEKINQSSRASDFSLPRSSGSVSSLLSGSLHRQETGGAAPLPGQSSRIFRN